MALGEQRAKNSFNARRCVLQSFSSSQQQQGLSNTPEVVANYKRSYDLVSNRTLIPYKKSIILGTYYINLHTIKQITSM